MKIRRRLYGAAAGVSLAALAAAGLSVPAQAAPYSTTFDVAPGSQYVSVNRPAGHGYLVAFAVGYTDGYVHKDPIPASSKVREIDNYTGQAPDVQGWDGCATTGRHQHQPDQLSATDNDSDGLGGGTTPATGLHHGVTITIKPVGSGPYFLWCHYEHGPETWVMLTYQDGSTVEIYWSTPTYMREIFLVRGAPVTTVAAVGPDE